MERITNADRVTSVWQKVMRIVRADIVAAQGQLEGSLSFDETNRVRGRLIALRKLERLDQDEPDVQ